MRASSIFDQMACSSAATAVASRPSLRIRITDGSRAALVASKEWKSASSVTQTRKSERARRRIFWVVGTTHADFGDVKHVPSARAQQSGRRSRQTLIEQKAFHTGSRGCTLWSRIPRRKFECLANIFRFKFGVLAAEIIPARIDRKRRDDTLHRKAHPTDRRLSVEDIRVRRDSIKRDHGFLPGISALAIISQAGSANNIAAVPSWHSSCL